MPKFFEIPLSPNPQRFTISLSGTEYQLTLAYRSAPGGGWVLDISDKQGAAIVQGIPLVTGADLLAQYKHLGFAGRLWVQSSVNPDDVPTFDNLGNASFLFWVTD
jgi:hypothetical protein